MRQLEAHLRRVEALEPQLNAFIRLRPDEVLADAARQQARLDTGDDLPLSQVLLAVKDIIDVAEVPTTAHSRLLLHNIAERDATVIRSLRKAGAILLGKTATHEFAYGGPAADLPWPPARNPWNPAHFTAGSSSGSATAVAAGFADMALGSDTMGSIRGPAAYCGLVGLKPTYGLVSRSGVIPLAQSLDHVGPITRSVRDAAMMLNVIAGHDAADPASAYRLPRDATARLGQDVRGMRIGVLRRWFTRDLPATPEMQAAVEAALSVFRGLGMQVVDIEPSPLDVYDAVCRVILQAEAYAVHEADLRSRLSAYSRVTQVRLLAGAGLSAADYVQAQRHRRHLSAEMAGLMGGVDAVACPVMVDSAPALERALAAPPVFFKPRNFNGPFNVTGQPALSLPCGFCGNGLPLGLQLAGHPFEEDSLLQIAHAYEQATDWHRRRPPLWAGKETSS